MGLFRNTLLTIEEYQHHSNYHINLNWSHQQFIHCCVEYSWYHIRDIQPPVCSHPLLITIEYRFTPILYSPLIKENIIQNTTATEIDPIRSAFSSVWNIPNPIEETSDNQFVLILYRSRYSTDLFIYYNLRFYIYWLFRHPHTRIPYIRSNYCLQPSSVPIFFIYFPTFPHYRP